MVLVPKGKYGFGWQILDKIFQEVLAFLWHSRRQVGLPTGSGVRNGVTFARVVKGLLEIVADIRNSNGLHAVVDDSSKQWLTETHKEMNADSTWIVAFSKE